MSQTKQNPYTAEFRESAVKLAVESDQSVAQTARDLGVNENTLHTWIGKYHRSSSQSNKAKNDIDQQHLYDELKQLRKENKRLRMEKEILKKASTFFAQEMK